MATLTQVIEGLKKGRSYERAITEMGAEYGGIEHITPAAHPSEVHHDVRGSGPQGGWGGSAMLPITTLNNGRFEKEGWVEKKKSS